MTKPNTSINFAQLDFPSDRLNVRTIRMNAKERHSFAEHDPENEPPRREGIFGLYDMFSTERAFARNAFQAALTRKETMSTKEWRHRLIDLDMHYQKYGLSTGEQNTKELVQQIEEHAVALAADSLDSTTANKQQGHAGRVAEERKDKGPPGRSGGLLV
jgi:hypothetical protein